MKWKSFKEEYPKSNCGILIKIIDAFPEKLSSESVRNKIYYGYVFPDCDYIYIIYEITSNSSMGWKALKDFKKEDIYWYYDSVFSNSDYEHQAHKD